MHLEWILHGDVTGTAMCQEDAGPIFGQIYLTINGQGERLRGITPSHWFTSMCLPSGTGDEVIVIIIFDTK